MGFWRDRFDDEVFGDEGFFRDWSDDDEDGETDEDRDAAGLSQTDDFDLDPDEAVGDVATWVDFEGEYDVDELVTADDLDVGPS
jgi:hypothetical protein